MPWTPKHLLGPLLDGLSLRPFAVPVWLPRSCAERAGGVVCQLLADVWRVDRAVSFPHSGPKVG